MPWRWLSGSARRPGDGLVHHFSDSVPRDFKAARASLLAWRAAFIEIANPLELYVFEAYAALELDTGCDAGGWNTLATH